MKTTIFSFHGEVLPGDLVMISAYAPKGGRSTSKVKVPADGFTLEQLVTAFAADINGAKSEFTPGTGDYRATAKQTKLVVMASDVVSNHRYEIDIEPPRGKLRVDEESF